MAGKLHSAEQIAGELRTLPPSSDQPAQPATNIAENSPALSMWLGRFRRQLKLISPTKWSRLLPSSEGP